MTTFNSGRFRALRNFDSCGGYDEPKYGIIRDMGSKTSFLFFFCAVFLVGALGAGEVAPAPLTDGEVWNQGVDYYRAGDVTNALRVLKPLMLSKTHGARGGGRRQARARRGRRRGGVRRRADRASRRAE